MIYKKSQLLSAWFLFADLLMTALAWLGAYHVRFTTGWFAVETYTPDISLCYRNIPLVVILGALAYRLTDQYVIHRFRRLREEFVSVFLGTALMGLFVVATTFGLHNPYESRGAILWMSAHEILKGAKLVCINRDARVKAAHRRPVPPRPDGKHRMQSCC